MTIGRRVPGILVGLGVLLAGWLTGCEPVPPTRPSPRPLPPAGVSTEAGAPVAKRISLPHIATIRTEPKLRIRIGSNLTRVELRSDGGLKIGPIGSGFGPHARIFGPQVVITGRPGSFTIVGHGRQAIRWALPELMVMPVRAGDAIRFQDRAYPGTIVLAEGTDTRNRPTGKIDVVEHVGMETYLPGVIERELYGSWDTEAFRAAAIAARSYAIFEASLNTHRHYDLESTTASQAYLGRSSHPKAVAAVRQTRGQVLSYQGRIVPAFYSSACGGTGQDATAAFTWLPGLPDIEPLRGRRHGDFCRSSSKFRWGPVTRQKATLVQRMRQWGHKENHPIRLLTGLRDIRITRTNAGGRPTAFTVYDNNGSRYTLGPEQFRFACNQSGPGLPKPDKTKTLYSSHVRVKVKPTTVVFYDGRGYGHGVGLCQFGTQTLALTGYNAYSILSYYYPGAQVVKAYP